MIESTQRYFLEPLLTVAEVAATLRLSTMTVYRLIDSGELRALRIGRSFRIPSPHLRDYLDTIGHDAIYRDDQRCSG